MRFAEFLVVTFIAVIYVVPFWRIAKRMGYPGLLGLLALLPGINLLLAWYIAFAVWPGEKRRRAGVL